MIFLNKNKKVKFLLLTFLVFYFFSFAIFVNAFEAQYPEIFGISIGGGSLEEYARYFFNIGIFLAIILAGLVTAIGGIYYLVDFAMGKIASEGKEWLKAGIIGLLLTTCSYLILYTINPALVVWDLKSLAPLTYIANILNPSESSNLNIEIYNEIPIGTLTENLLSETIDCYDFDGNGDPIDGEEITTDDGKKIIGPTYLEHDGVDCILKLAQAAEKKSEIVEKLSDEIVKLMEQCDCSKSSKSSSSSSSSRTSTSDYLCLNKTCSKKIDSGDALGQKTDCKSLVSSASCETEEQYDWWKENYGGTTDYCKDSCTDTSCECSGKECDVCPENYKSKISGGIICLPYLCGETNDLRPIHSGAISTSASYRTDSPECKSTEKEFVGLDEFKSQYSNDYEIIKEKVEIQPTPTINEKEISVINNNSCGLCDIKCSACDSSNKNYSECLKEKTRCEKKISGCENERKQCLLKNSAWYQLRLIDQLTYLNGKIEEIKSKMQQNADLLEMAEDELGRCYLADTSVDFLKIYEQTDKEKTTIVVKESYTDANNKLINPAKYCEGFQYNNSTCYSQCHKMCPGNQQSDFDCYKNVIDCSDKSGSEKDNCLATQTADYKKCFYNSSCTEGTSSFSTFQGCFTSCQQDCLENCNTLCDNTEKNLCQQICNNNSKCVLENADTCLFNFNDLKNCAQTYGDLESRQICSESAKLCEYCSDQNAGYAECLKNPAGSNYSSSYLYENPSYQRCETENKIVSGTSGACIVLYPETKKCPASSNCPSCKCDEVDLNNLIHTDTTSISGGSNSESASCQTTNPTLSNYCAEGKCVNGVCQKYSSSSSSSSGGSTNNIEYRVCSGACDKFSYSDDPLTFYCNTTWWKKESAKKTTSEGEERICKKEKEIPVGKTVDDAEAWINTLLENTDKLTGKIQKMIDYIKYIGEQKDYCQCDSKCDDAGKEATCEDKCVLNPTEIISTTTTYSEGEQILEKSVSYGCPCTRSGCSGNPCEKIINLLKGKKSSDNCPKGVEYKGITYYKDNISNAVIDFNIFTTKNNRSEILKELNYSRNKTDECSLTENNYDTKTELMSCTRVEDEIISPIIDNNNYTIINGEKIASYCYGKELGETKGGDALMDNWFCCELRVTSTQ